MNSIYIRKRTMRSGRVYLYLQYYPPIRNPRTNKAIRWEALKLEIFPNPKTTFEREHNKSMIEMAEIIKSKRMMLLAVDSNVDFPQIVIEKGATKRGIQR